MPNIRSSAELRNNYNDETYEMLTSRFELYAKIKEGLDDIKAGRVTDFDKAMAGIRAGVR